MPARRFHVPHEDCCTLCKTLSGKGLEPNETVCPAMTLYGYARVSSLDQDLMLQEATLRTVGYHIVRAERRRAGRAIRAAALARLRASR